MFNVAEEISDYLILNGIEEEVISLNSFIEEKQKQVYIRQYNGKRSLVTETEEFKIQFLIRDSKYNLTVNLVEQVRKILNIKDFYSEEYRYFFIEELSFGQLETNLFNIKYKIIREKKEI